MTPINYEATIKVDERVVLEKKWTKHDVMKTSQVVGWVRRQFNKTLKNAGKDQIVVGQFRGQLKRDPYTPYSGLLSGVNGKVMAQRGLMDPYL